jgi:hypothetical protein
MICWRCERLCNGPKRVDEEIALTNSSMYSCCEFAVLYTVFVVYVAFVHLQGTNLSMPAVRTYALIRDKRKLFFNNTAGSTMEDCC